MSRRDGIRLVADLLGLIGRYDCAAIERALEYASREFAPEMRPRWEVLLSALQSLSEDTQRIPGGAEPNQARASKASKTRTSSEDGRIRELRTMLGDPAFAPSKRDALSVLKACVKEFAEYEPSTKQGRRDIVRRFFSVYRGLSSSRQEAVFGNLRRAYLRGRGADLMSWSDLIANGSGQP